MQANPIVIDKKIEAPLSAVWKCWSESEFVSIWYGPGVKTVMHYFDFNEEGYWQEEMKVGDKSMHGRSEFAEIIPGRKIVLRQSSVDEHGNIIANPMIPNWPETVDATVMFVDEGDYVRMNFTWAPHQASDEEIAVFNEMAPKMAQGWEKGFEILEAEAKKLA